MSIDEIIVWKGYSNTLGDLREPGSYSAEESFRWFANRYLLVLTDAVMSSQEAMARYRRWRDGMNREVDRWRAIAKWEVDQKLGEEPDQPRRRA